MSVRVNIPMSQFMRKLIQLGVRTYVRDVYSNYQILRPLSDDIWRTRKFYIPNHKVLQ